MQRLWNALSDLFILAANPVADSPRPKFFLPPAREFCTAASVEVSRALDGYLTTHGTVDQTIKKHAALHKVLIKNKKILPQKYSCGGAARAMGAPRMPGRIFLRNKNSSKITCAVCRASAILRPPCNANQFA
jgi:hypothetical protein